jgi:hypothetical protein
VLPRAILLLGALAAACFSEAPQDATASTGSATEQPTTAPTTTADTTADTTAGDPSEACRACQATQCEGYTQACMDTADCNICTEQPFDLSCLTSDAFRPLAFCSCDRCAEDCGYVCPGDGGACQSCFTDNCALGECTVGNGCLPCLQDPYGEGCAENPAFQAIQTCACEQCEAPCLWMCEGAVDTCSMCLAGETCGGTFNSCLQDTECDACFANPSRPGCDTNMLYLAVGVCVCNSCPDECGLLFGCA